MRRPLVQGAIALLACAALLGGLIALGQHLREKLRDSPRHQFPFRDIEVAAPPELDRAAFLSEVQYLSELPDDVPLLDDELPARLAAAFSRHAWVEHVDKVEIGPGRAVRVRLMFRTPVLLVNYAVTAPSTGRSLTTRAVDGAGILLPRFQGGANLPRLKPTAVAPSGAAGQPWGDKLIERSAALAALLHAHQREFRLMQIDFTDGEFRLVADSGAAVIWGHAPSEEAEGEASATEKLARLLAYYDKHGGLDRPNVQMVHDVRAAEKPID